MFRNLGQKIKNRKGFTLIELIVVIAILGILALIAIPKLTTLQASSKVKADAATAAQIVTSARIQEADNSNVKVTALTQTGTAASGDLQKTYMVVPAPQSGGTFAISGGADANYVIKWTADVSGYAAEQTFTENTKFVPVAK